MDRTWPWSEWRCISLARCPRDGEIEIDEAESQHLARVLRARVGDRVLGLDGCGGAWPLRVQSIGRGGVDLAPDGEPFLEPAPGEPGARVGRVELAVAWPRPQVAEEMFDALVQMGCARVTALVSARSQDWARDWTESRRARLDRIAREACKQSRRLWRPEVVGPVALAPWLDESKDVRRVLLEPRADHSLRDWLRGQPPGRTGDPICVIVGPEGGWSEEERAACRASGLAEARIDAFVLRTQLAAELAVAVALQQRERSTSHARED